jgi:hypothetical protein
VDLSGQLSNLPEGLDELIDIPQGHNIERRTDLYLVTRIAAVHRCLGAEW